MIACDRNDRGHNIMLKERTRTNFCKILAKSGKYINSEKIVSQNFLKIKLNIICM